MKTALNKEVCKKCFQKCANLEGWLQTWDYDDEHRWDLGEIGCPCAGFVFIDRVPEECPYKLEHMVINDSEQENLQGLS